jgi:adenylate cyclase class 2
VSAPSWPVETEIKIPAPDLSALRRALLAAGARPLSEKHDERNILFDDETGSLHASGRALRLRSARGRHLVTFKGDPRMEGAIRSRMELETEIADAPTFEKILEALRLRPRFRYEKRREEFRLEQCLVALDETPIGDFIEIEGLPDQIRKALALLRLDPACAVLESYPALYARRRKDDPALPPDMLFPS